MLTHPHFDPVAIQLGPLAIRWYGLMYLVGFAAAYGLGRLRIAAGKSSRVTVAVLDDLLFFGVLGVILGGRLGYVLFYKPGYYLQHPAEILAVWQGGMAFHGGFLGVLLAVWWIARKHQLRWLEVTDFLAPLAPLAFAAGRLGNFINGELWGRVTEVAWGMVFRGAGPAPRHPSQLYQFALEGIALFVILWLYSSKPRPDRRGVGRVPHRVRRVPLQRRVLPRARRFSGPARARVQHGAVALPADDRRRGRPARLGIAPALESGKPRGGGRCQWTKSSSPCSSSASCSSRSSTAILTT